MIILVTRIIGIIEIPQFGLEQVGHLMRTKSWKLGFIVYKATDRLCYV